MRTTLDCVPCFVRQTSDATRIVSQEPVMHERILRDTLRLAAEMDLNNLHPAMAQRIHPSIRELTVIADPYHAAQERQSRLALELWSELQTMVGSATDRLAMAIRLAIAGNVIDFGVDGHVTEADLHRSLCHALAEPFVCNREQFRAAVARSNNILHLADNGGEIVFERLPAEQLAPARVTFAVRGAPILNDVMLADAQAVELTDHFEVIDDGSDAPGTILRECSAQFRQRFESADLMVAKGQGNFETIIDATRDIFSCSKPNARSWLTMSAFRSVRRSSIAQGENDSPCPYERLQTNCGLTRPTRRWGR